MLLSILNIFLALLSRSLMSLPASQSCLVILPKWMNSSVVGRSSPFTWICEGLGKFKERHFCFLFDVLPGQLAE